MCAQLVMDLTFREHEPLETSVIHDKYTTNKYPAGSFSHALWPPGSFGP